MVSLIIPTYNRPSFLWRLLEYYQRQKSPYEMVVADSSGFPACDANKRIADSLRDSLNIRYVLFPQNTHIAIKLRKALENVESKYAVICGDDDFIIPKTIENCVAFLEANPSYAIAHGRSVILSINHNKNCKMRITTYRQRTIDSVNPSDRLQNHLMDYTTTFYSVHRRSQLLGNMKVAAEEFGDIETKSNGANEFRFIELLLSCLSLIQGKSMCLDMLYMVRQSHPNQIAKTSTSLTKLLTSNDFSRHYSRFRDSLVRSLEIETGLTQCELEEVVNTAFLFYLKKGLNTKVKMSDEESKSIMRLVRKIIQRLFMTIYAGLYEYQVLIHPKDKMLMSVYRPVSIHSLLRHKSPFRVDFLPVYEHVLRYPSGISLSEQEKADG